MRRKSGYRVLVLTLVLQAVAGCASTTGSSAGTPPYVTPQSCNLIEVYVREGCPYCALAKGYLESLKARRPDLTVTLYDIRESEENMTRYRSLTEEYRLEHPGVPTFLICRQVIVGFSEAGTPPAIEALIGD